MSGNTNARLDAIERELRQDWRYLVTLPLEDLSDIELNEVVSHLDVALGDEMARFIRDLSMNKLEALADGDLSPLSDEERALVMRFEQAYQDLGHDQHLDSEMG
jgi:hypothetical protein